MRCGVPAPAGRAPRRSLVPRVSAKRPSSPAAAMVATRGGGRTSWSLWDAPRRSSRAALASPRRKALGRCRHSELDGCVQPTTARPSSDWRWPSPRNTGSPRKARSTGGTRSGAISSRWTPGANASRSRRRLWLCPPRSCASPMIWRRSPSRYYGVGSSRPGRRDCLSCPSSACREQRPLCTTSPSS